jgi:transposase
MSMEVLTQLLGLPHVVVLSFELPNDHTILLDVEIQTPVAMCPTCHHLSTVLHSYARPRTVRDLDVWGRTCYLRFRPRQFECDTCHNTFIEPLAWLDPYQHQTQRLEMRVYDLARRTNVAESARYHGLSDERTESIFLREAQHQVTARGYPLVDELHVDEIAEHKGHGNYLLVLSSPTVGVLDVLENRLKETFEAWLDARGPAWCAAVHQFHADMWAPYHEVARAKLPNVKITTADHFHVIQNLNDALSNARRAIQREANEVVRSQLKGCRWLLVKNREKLTDTEREQLTTVGQASPDLKACYELKEDFRAIYTLTNWNEAANRLMQWLEQARQVKLTAIQTFVKTVENWREHILGFFDGRGSNGFAEGVNNKIKLIKRRAYGCPNFQHFRLRILVAFGS